jgi:hypothetical protein
MPSAEFELGIPAIERLQTYALDCTATEIDFKRYELRKNLKTLLIDWPLL